MRSAAPRPASAAPVVYPDSDGEPMADNTEQFAFIQLVQGNLDTILPDFVAGDHLWYPVEGRPDIRTAPDVYVAMGRPKGHRGSYRQWVEGGVPLTVVFEWWSPNSTFPKEVGKLRFYDRYGVEEFYTWDQVRHLFTAYIREDGELRPVDVSDGWVSPLLGIRFEVKGEELAIYRPDGTPFLTLAELDAQLHAAVHERDAAVREREAAAARVRALEERLRALGIDPSAL